jgi:hypothetical protein
MLPSALLFQNPSQNLYRVCVLQDIEQCGIHRQMLNRFKHDDQVIRFEQLTGPQKT